MPAGQFFIDTEDPAKLKSALEQERTAREKTALELKLLTERVDGADGEAAKKAAEKAAADKLELEKTMIENKDMQAMLDQFKADREADRAEFKKQLADRDAKQADEKAKSDAAIVKANAKSFCAKHFGDEEGTLSALIEPRLRNGVGNELSAVDADGNPMSMEDFTAEVLANPVLTPMIQKSKGSGVGDTRDIGSPVDINGRTLDQLDSDEQSKLLKENPEQFKQLQDASPEPVIDYSKPGNMM